MIPNKETNRVYFSDMLRSDTRYAKAYTGLCTILTKHGITSRLLDHTKDIWCRDYMPIQVSSDRYIQFRYQPSYLRDIPELRTDPTLFHAACCIPPILSDINLDGGNIVHCSDKAILTDRVLDENPTYTHARLLRELEELLQVEVILIPQIKSDMTGHADGMLNCVSWQVIPLHS